jgi:hypothetical protein
MTRTHLFGGIDSLHAIPLIAMAVVEGVANQEKV